MATVKDEFNISFSRKLKTLRKDHGWSQGQLGKRIDIDPQRISKYEQGKSMPPAKTMVKIAEVFGVSLDYLMKGIGPDNTSALKNPKLSERFEEINSLPQKDQDMLVAIIDAFVKKYRFEEVAQG